MKIKIIYILSLGHSGSTIIDLSLGCHDDIIGVGEAHRLFSNSEDWINRTGEVFCSCGALLDHCVFWSGIVNIVKEKSEISDSVKYQLLINHFGNMFGEGKIMVDSSKNLEALEILTHLSDVSIKVIYLVKDVRSWTVSWLETLKRYDELSIPALYKLYGIKGIFKVIKGTSSFHFINWFLKNRRLKRRLKQSHIPFFQCGYEEIALYPEYMLPKLCEFIGIEFNKNMLKPSLSNSHSTLGNRMRNQADKKQGIFYDNRWFTRTNWLFPSLLFHFIIKYNNRETYRNTTGSRWNK